MKRFAVRMLIGVFSCALLFLLLNTLSSPVLFGPENLSPTPHHVPVASLNIVSGDESAKVLPLLQEVMNGTAAITISLRTRDFPSAQNELRTYLEKSSQLQHLIIRLNLSDTDLETFHQANEQNLIDLAEMANLTERFSNLEVIEVNYRSEDRPDLLYSVSYEGETIRNRVGAIAEGYALRKHAVINTSRSFDLDAATYERSITEVSSIAEEIVVRQTDRVVNLEKAPPSPYLLTLALEPRSAEYGDAINLSGSLISGPASARAISLFVDSRFWREVPIDGIGGYRASYPVQNIGAGTHIVYALYERTYSEISTFTLRSRPTQITLTSGVTGDGKVLSRGTLFTGAVPVSSAPIELSSDGLPLHTVNTNDKGLFTLLLDPSPVEQRIRARFLSRDFPLEPSEAELVIGAVTAGPSVYSSFTGLVVFAACAGMAAWFILRRRSHRVGNAPASPASPSPSPSRQSPLADLSLTLTRYWGMLLRGDVQEGVHLLYRTLADTLAHRRAIPHAPTLTPRELAGKAADLSPDLPEWVARYEKIRYAGEIPTDQEHETFTSRFLSLIRYIRGGLH